MLLCSPGRLKIFFGFSAKFEAQNVFFIHSFNSKFWLQRGARDFWMPWWSLSWARTHQFVINMFNSLAPGRPRCHFKTAIFNLVLLIGIFTSSKDNALRWMPRELTDNKSTLVQVMAWCCQATSHYLSQCWPCTMSPYGVTSPQWVKVYQGIQQWYTQCYICCIVMGNIS